MFIFEILYVYEEILAILSSNKKRKKWREKFILVKYFTNYRNTISSEYLFHLKKKLGETE
jgi:hypothetical protein